MKPQKVMNSLIGEMLTQFEKHGAKADGDKLPMNVQKRIAETAWDKTLDGQSDHMKNLLRPGYNYFVDVPVTPKKLRGCLG